MIYIFDLFFIHPDKFNIIYCWIFFIPKNVGSLDHPIHRPPHILCPSFDISSLCLLTDSGGGRLSWLGLTESCSKVLLWQTYIFIFAEMYKILKMKWKWKKTDNNNNSKHFSWKNWTFFCFLPLSVNFIPFESYFHYCFMEDGWRVAAFTVCLCS